MWRAQRLTRSINFFRMILFISCVVAACVQKESCTEAKVMPALREAMACSDERQRFKLGKIARQRTGGSSLI